MEKNISCLTDGLLYSLQNKVIWHLVYSVSADEHAKSYRVSNENDMYAEPEFTGKYLDLCSEIYRLTENDKALENAQKIVKAITENQRADGYLGCLPKGKELLNFSVWNQAFTILGLVSEFSVSHDQGVLSTAIKCAEYVMRQFIDGKADIMDALNYGTQHISILYSLCKLYRVTSDDRIKDYIFFIIDAIKHSESNFFDFDDVLSLKSRKGIENFVILLGILEYSDIFSDEAATKSVRKYWRQIRDTQIRNTGNGTINELWTENGNSCMLLGSEVKANETCVAVGWIELSLALFYHEQKAEYLDAIDKTLYNHILASVSDDGSDFAYYQPNYGEKIRTTENGMYKCCRYRGFTLFTYMNDMLFFEDESNIIPMLYTSCDYKSEAVVISETSNYPFDNSVKFQVDAAKKFNFKIRIPNNYALDNIEIDNKVIVPEIQDGYIVIEFQKGDNRVIVLNLKPLMKKETGTIGDIEYASFTYGCVLLAQNNVSAGDCIANETMPKKSSGKLFGRLSFYANGKNDSKNKQISFCDYASADNYAVWIPIAETEEL